MRQAPNSSDLQLNLSLIHPNKATVPSGQQKELEMALAELLIRAAEDHVRSRENVKSLDGAKPVDGEVNHES